MKLTLIGYGFVGKAVHEVLKDYHEVKIVDPQYNDNVINNDSDGYIVCVLVFYFSCVYKNSDKTD